MSLTLELSSPLGMPGIRTAGAAFVTPASEPTSSWKRTNLHGGISRHHEFA
ncbi:MAG TPA: hypothetical protein VE889_04520 [Actinomycetota bacterium]|nr:hypothetical protein [Actinomycetota bacterium]